MSHFPEIWCKCSKNVEKSVFRETISLFSRDFAKKSRGFAENFKICLDFALKL